MAASNRVIWTEICFVCKERTDLIKCLLSRQHNKESIRNTSPSSSTLLTVAGSSIAIDEMIASGSLFSVVFVRKNSDARAVTA